MHLSEHELQALLARGQVRVLGERDPTPAPALSEEAFQQAVIRLAKDCGYLTFYVHDSRRSPHGWPDVAAIKPTGGTLYLCELKTETGHLTLAQQAWLDALAGCTGVVAEIWRPSMFSEIAARLRGEEDRRG